MYKKTIASILLVCFVVAQCNVTLPVHAAEDKERTIVVSGKVQAIVDETGALNAKKQIIPVGTHKVSLSYYYNGTQLYSMGGVKTDDEGYFSIEMKVKGSGTLEAQIASENAACVVKSSFSSSPYKYKLKPVKISEKQTSVNLDIQIADEKCTGAFNIAQNIYKMREYFKNELGYDKIPKVTVFWKKGKGDGNSSTVYVYLPMTDKIGFIEIDGYDRDEFDVSLICHEYAHWIYGTISDRGRVAFGDHFVNEPSNPKLAYSEGLATFAGQSYLNDDYYVDEGVLSPVLESLENTGVIVASGNAIEYEDIVMQCLWDLYDQYSQNELWDLMEGKEKEIFNENKFLIETDKLASLINPYNLTLKRFYTAFYIDQIAPNSKDSYDYWNIFKNNECQFDEAPPFIKLLPTLGTGLEGSFGDLDIYIGDDIAVNKATITIDGGKIYKNTINWNFRDKYTFGLTALNLKPGRHTMAIKATDFAGNSVSITPDMTIPKKLLTDGSGAYRTPYTMAYYSFTVPEGEVISDSGALLLQEDGAALNDGNSAEDATEGNINEAGGGLRDSSGAAITQPGEEPVDASTLDGDAMEDTATDGDAMEGAAQEGGSSEDERPEPADLTDADMATIPGDPAAEDGIPEAVGASHPLAEEHQLSYAGGQAGMLADNAISESFTFQVGAGTDYALLSDDLLGDFALELTDPAGNRYYAGQGYDNLNGQESNGQVVLNLGSQGAMIFHGLPGTWGCRIINQGAAASYNVGLYTQIAAPVLDNPEALKKLQSGDFSVSGSCAALEGGTVHLRLTDGQGGLVEERLAPAAGNFTALFQGIPDGSYCLEAWVGSADGAEGWDSSYDVTILSAAPVINLDEDYEFYQYDGTASISGGLTDGGEVSVTCNGVEAEVSYASGWGSLPFTVDLSLQPGANQVVLTAVGETGLMSVCTLTLYSQETLPAAEPEITLVTFDGSVEGNIQEGTRIEVTLADEDTSNYQVQAVLRGQLYDLAPGDGSYSLTYTEPVARNGNESMMVYATSKWQTMALEEYPVTFVGGEGIYALRQPEDLETDVGKEVTLSLTGIFSGNSPRMEASYGVVDGQAWSFTPVESGLFPVKITAYTATGEASVDFNVVVTDDGVRTVAFNPAGGTVEPVKASFTVGESYGALPVPERYGYEFQGWYTDPSAGKKQDKGDIYSEEVKELYARWLPLGCRLRFHGNGGTVAEEGKQVYYGREYGTLPSAYKEGFHFLGWFTEPSGGVEVEEGSIVTELSPRLLYAHWGGPSYTVAFQANGGTVSPAEKEVVASHAYGELPVPVREGYAFDGWSMEPDGGEVVTEETVVEGTMPQTLYAQWTAEGYTVTFHANGGSVPVSSKKVKNGNAYGSLPTPSRDSEYSFLGWFTEKEGGVQVLAAQTVGLSGNQDLYAHWQRNQYRVNFNPNGGSMAGPTSRMVTNGEAFGELPVPVLKNYDFTGWYTSLSASTEVTAATKVNTNYEMTLYAIWKGKESTVTFQPEGGTVATGEKQVYYGELYGTLPTPTRPGYDFLGWYTTHGVGEHVTAKTTVRAVSDATLYAHWQVRRPLITFNANGGTMLFEDEWVKSGAKNYAYGELFGSLPAPEREGYHFTGWHTAQTSGNEVTSTSTVAATVDDTLYAHWEGNHYQVAFLDAAGSAVAGTKDAVFGNTYGELPEPAKANYVFGGWYTDPVGGKQVTSSTKVATAQNHALYARFTGVSMKASYDTNGGTSTSTGKTVYYGDAYGALAKPTRTGYEFDGWYTAASGGNPVTEETIVAQAGAHTLYAHWAKREYTLTFDANGGECEVSERVLRYLAPLGALPAATRPGYTFLGWYTSAAGTTMVTASDSITGNKKVYAKWEGSPYTVSLHANGGTVATASKEVKTGSTYGTLPKPTWAGHTFGGWYTEVDGGICVTSTTKVDYAHGKRLYAHWSDLTYKITYSPNGGTVSPTYTTVSKGLSYSSFPTPTRAGYRFVGWYSSTSSTASRITSVSTADTLYAHWEGLETEVSFDGAGVDVTPSSKTVAYGSTYGTLPSPTRANYTFQGWYLGSTKVTAASTVKLLEPATLTASWKGVSSKVTYDAYGGSTSTKTKAVYYGDEYGTLPSPTRAGHDFQGWFTAKSGGTAIEKDTVVDWAVARTLYAHWEPKTPTVVFNANNGRIWEDGTKHASVEKVVTYGQAYGKLPEPEREGYEFQGWFTSSTGTNQVTAGMTVSVTSTQNLYAHWKGVESTVTFDPDGGNCGTRSMQVCRGEDYGTLPVPERYGFKFLGWYTAKEGGGKVTASSEVMEYQAHTLYALWENVSYTVTLDFNGGSIRVDDNVITSSSKTVSYLGTYGGSTGKLSAPGRSGYRLAGWFTEDGEPVTIDTTVMAVEKHKLYAHWIPKEYVVVFNPDGGNPVGETKTVTYKETYGALPVPTREHYTFMGWYTTKTGNVQVASDTEVNFTSKKTVYAHWEPDYYRVTLDAQGGSVEALELAVAYEEELGTLPVPVRGSDKFLGWYTARVGGEKMTAGSTLQIPADIRLYARWQGSQLTVTFNGNGGSVSTSSKKIKQGGYYSTLPAPTRSGYDFLGWYTELEGGMLVTGQDRAIAEGNHTLYAHWEPKRIMAVFYGNGGRLPEGAGCKEVAYKGSYGVLPLPEREGYRFLGWYTLRSGGTRVTEETTISKYVEIPLYARWEKVE